ncbi:MAG TPA: YbjQ family protein [Candidatus Hodarchaeales archaeon]|nr:YbjQ family protein [Candidatus Hodarchaeales archaeon]
MSSQAFSPSGQPITPPEQILVSTTDDIVGMEIVQHLGMVFGITVRGRGMGGQCIGGCQLCVGGEITAFAESSHEARNDALYRLASDASQRGANGIIGVKFDSSRSGQRGEMMDIVAYGTAVRCVPKR